MTSSFAGARDRRTLYHELRPVVLHDVVPLEKRYFPPIWSRPVYPQTDSASRAMKSYTGALGEVREAQVSPFTTWTVEQMQVKLMFWCYELELVREAGHDVP